MQNRPNVYTINDAPPSYTEATGASNAQDTHNPQFDQRHPHIVAYPSPSAPLPNPYMSNYYLDRAPVQSAYPPLAEWRSQPTSLTYNRTLITPPRQNASCGVCFIKSAVTIGMFVPVIIILVWIFN
ncbi:PREDICTED: uncharacterized protein LOC105455933 [Wasmannia auropunctata]|uniref:uncharacterized protein LOC105455933 n=1 Tax=Wasmannia auropunctata TaxID=64793 RepID=UPI0005EE1D50|nr:PREDICTED: uncharacterized protein LOC105455933 [Wasmannia auropunctata]XP_011697943.1 PREDICTED: uncharacterized protein LOC105455933 [Wasmannia auropunctata]XP_011697944.1 PREDICTED: uncharacterized protein LOC105455933 [Wasmannia auropunctata]XP_011697945.1 PREDICTED: uncharacterized protein LOC105455933 [Wasmannia auropunctata]